MGARSAWGLQMTAASATRRLGSSIAVFRRPLVGTSQGEQNRQSVRTGADGSQRRQ